MVSLEERLGYAFKDAELLARALAHPSLDGARNNQRLEFLGDAVLELAVSDYLYRSRSGAPEGELTVERARLVCERSLASAARSVGLGAFINMNAGEEKSGGREKPSILSDAMEAVLGAIYLDGGAEAAFKVALRALRGEMEAGAGAPEKDCKSRLQELAQRRGGDTPSYELVSRAGAPHEPVFVARVALGERSAEGEGHSRRAAEQAAAEAALRDWKL